MNKNYMKTLMLIFTISMIAFIIPDSFADHCRDHVNDPNSVCPDVPPVEDTSTDDVWPTGDDDVWPTVNDNRDLCRYVNESYLIPSTTSNSITINWLDDLNCDIPRGAILVHNLTFENNPTLKDTVNGRIFSDLDSDTEYLVTLDVYYTLDYNERNNDLVFMGTVIQTIFTQDAAPVECVELDDIHLTLTSTTDSITANWSDLPICDVPLDAKSIYLTKNEGNLIHSGDDVSGSSSYTFSGLDPDNLYEVELVIHYDETFTDIVGSVFKTINTDVEESVNCTDIADLDLTLIPTFDSITVNWPLVPVCENERDNVLSYTLELYGTDIVLDSATNGDSFVDLKSNTEYTVYLNVWYTPDIITDTQVARTSYLLGSTSAVTITLAAPVDCIVFDERFDDFYPSLSSTPDTITATWPEGPICNNPIDAIKSITLSLDSGVHIDAVSGHTFEDLQSLTLYTVELEFTYTRDDGEVIVRTFDDYISTKDVGDIEPEPPQEISDELEAKGGCSGDCTPPTIGLDEDNKRLVDHGFSYNNNPVDVIAWHTPYPLITAIVNQTNTVEITVYDNQGIFYIDMVQFGLGLEDLGQALHDVEVLIEVHLEAVYSENNVIVEKVVIRDRDNLIDTFSVFAVTEVVDCIDDEFDEECLKITLKYSYREATINNMMVVNVADNARNTQNFYFNDGVEVIGESMNPTPFVILSNKLTNQQTEDLTLTLYRTDKINHIWMDGNGIEYLKIGVNNFDRITPPEPYTCNDPPLSEVNVPTRSNCHFRALVSFWNQ